MFSPEILRILFGFVAVLGLIALSALAARKLGLASVSGGMAKKRRLSIVETLAIDTRRRIVIVKCDNTEHLVILSATGETVVERNLDSVESDATADASNPFSDLVAAQDQFSNTKKDAA